VRRSVAVNMCINCSFFYINSRWRWGVAKLYVEGSHFISFQRKMHGVVNEPLYFWLNRIGRTLLCYRVLISRVGFNAFGSMAFSGPVAQGDGDRQCLSLVRMSRIDIVAPDCDGFLRRRSSELLIARRHAVLVAS